MNLKNQIKNLIDRLQNFSFSSKKNKIKTKQMTKRIFLGGTANNSNWRSKLTPLLDPKKLTWFDPVITGREWTLADQDKEFEEKDKADYLLYVVTKEMSGFYTIAEIVDDSNKNSERVVFCYLEEGFEQKQIRSLKAVAKLFVKNIKDKTGKEAQVFTDLQSLADWLNSQVEQRVERAESRIEIFQAQVEQTR